MSEGNGKSVQWVSTAARIGLGILTGGGIDFDKLPRLSRLNAHCISCKHKSSRRDFYKPKPGQVPAFIDICPKCKSTDVDVFDPIVEAKTREHYSDTGAFVAQKKAHKRVAREGGRFDE